MRQAPTDWLAIHASKLPRVEDNGPPTVFEFFDEFRSELENLRCRGTCDAHSPSEQVGCVCALADRLADLSGEWISKSEFAQVLVPAGFDQQQALQKYRLYAHMKLLEEAEPELEELGLEAENAYNWQVEKPCPQTHRAFNAAAQASRNRFEKVYTDLEKVMDTPS